MIKLLGCPQKQELCDGCVVKASWWLHLLKQKRELGVLAGQQCVLCLRSKTGYRSMPVNWQNGYDLTAVMF